MNKQQCTQRERKRYKPLTILIKTLLLLLLAFGINSCKKDVLVPASSKAKEKNGNKIKSIPYSQFLDKVELNSTGALKPVLQSAVNNNKSTKVGSVSSTPIYDIETTNVKELIVNDTISYVLALKPQTPRATHFQNITIQTAKGKTIAFLTTYVPTKEWIKEWKTGRHIDSVFRGDIYVNRINLNDVVTTSSKTNGTSIYATGQSSSINIGGNTIKLRPGECETYSVYETVSMPCGYAPNRHYSNADCTFWSTYSDPYNLPAGCRDYPPYTAVIYVGESMYCEPDVPPTPGTGGGGNTTPNPPGGYDPCNGNPPPPVQSSIKKSGGFNLQVIPPNPCDEDPNNPNEPSFDENEPISLPTEWDMELDEDWFATEDEYATSGALIAQTISGRTDPIPEMYYMNGVGIDMSPATPRNGRTVFNAPRNHQYFWKELVRIKPQMFDAANRSLIKAGVSPTINDQWLKYNPTHKSFKGQKLIHHHESQGNIAYAIPKTVHTKWSGILHQWRTTGKIPRAVGKTLNKLSIGINVASLFTGWFTGNPDAWINWYGGNKNEIGKVYYHQEKDCYFVITYKNDTVINGRLTKATVTYDVYEGYIWDYDENKYMGVIKLGTFTENLDVLNGVSEGTSWTTST